MIAKFLRSRPEKSKSGFTLIEVVIVLVILVIIIGVVILSISGFFGRASNSAYTEAKEQIQRAVAAYSATKAGPVPTLAISYTNDDCQNCNVVDLNALLTTNDGILRQAPTGLNLSADGNDNCGGNASLGCKTGSSYIWIVDHTATVYSYCTKPGEGGSNNSGYQNVWP